MQRGLGFFCDAGTTFLPIAGPIGTAIGLGLGGLVMLILAANFNYLINRFPDGGGIYTYTKKAFGYDHGFRSAWFLIITYIAIIWANATAHLFKPIEPDRLYETMARLIMEKETL